jgi:hypothetical protein
MASSDGNQKALAFDLSDATYMEACGPRMSIAVGDTLGQP